MTLLVVPLHGRKRKETHHTCSVYKYLKTWPNDFWKERTREYYTPGSTNIAMNNGPFEDVFPIEHGDIPLATLVY